KNNMIQQQLRTWEVLDERILAIVDGLAREDFVPTTYRDVAYADTAIPLAHEQIMLPPKEQARIVQELNITATDTVLEIGTGTGYLSALLASCAKSVTSVDIFPEFTEKASKNLEKTGLKNVTLLTEDASQATCSVLQEHYDVIVITCGLPRLSSFYCQALKPGGRLFSITGHAPAMQATITTKSGANTLETAIIFETVVPFIINSSQKSEFIF
ncbi:MAG: protein-L-isoaspartate O-methyltransferase, partial [Gammaproteobacteria bacterium]|nr:protein-L-isoaspartate O-methyltransferase [Gammaproteobacteria bacterium]